MIERKNELNILGTSFNKKQFKVRKKTPDYALTKNHESVKFRLRVQQQKEAEEELKEHNEDRKRTS